MPHFTMDVINYPYWDKSQSILITGVTVVWIPADRTTELSENKQKHWLKSAFLWLAGVQPIDAASGMRWLQWHHNGLNGVPNHDPHHCLLNRLFRSWSKKHQSSASLAFVRGIRRGPVNSPHTWPVTWKMFPVDDVIISHLPGFNNAHTCYWI